MHELNANVGNFPQLSMWLITVWAGAQPPDCVSARNAARSFRPMGAGRARRIQDRSVQKKPVKFDSRNKTSALEVTDIQIWNEAASVKVVLKNISTKSINGIQLSSNQGSVRVEFLDAHEPDRQRLLPGQTYVEMFPLTNSAEPFTVSVLAVTFDDKTSDGDSGSAKEIIDARRGHAKEMKRMLPLLEAAIASPEGDSPKILDKLKSQVETLPAEQSGDSFAFREGQQAAREDLLYDFQFFKERQSANPQVQIRRALAKAKTRYDKRIDYDF